MRSAILTRAAVACALMLANGPIVAAPDEAVGQALRALDARGLILDTQRLEQAAVDGVLRAVDPDARRMPRSQPLPVAEGPQGAQIEAWSNGILYVCMGNLARVEPIRSAITTNTAGIILDLRGAGGDDLDTLDSMGGLFFEDGVELYQLRNGSSNAVARHRARAPGPAPRLPPVMLLVDNQTHGTSEMLAALLQHRPQIMLLGTPTTGSAAWRERVALNEREDAFITTAWLTPTTGAVYRGYGVYPDVLVHGTTNLPPAVAPPPDTQTVAIAVAMTTYDAALVGRDSLLRRALDILLGLQALRQP